MSGIMVDIDGVLADFVGGFTTLGNAMFGLSVKRNGEQEDWSWSGSGWCTSEQENEIWECLKASSTFWRSLKTLSNVSAADLQLVAATHTTQPLIFVTSRPGRTAWRQTVDWLEERGIMEPLVVRTAKTLRKPAVCRGLGLMAAIEDSPMQLEELYKAGIETVKIRWPYNRLARAWATVASLEEALARFDVGVE